MEIKILKPVWVNGSPYFGFDAVRQLEANYKEAIEALTGVCKDYTEHDTEKIRCIIEKAYKYAWEDIWGEK